MLSQAQPNQTALLIIDVQLGLFTRNTPIYHAEDLLNNINTLITNARQASVPIIFIQHSNDSFLVQGSPGWQLHTELDRQSNDLLVHKTHGNAFQDTNLKQHLDEMHATHLVICGLVTHGCVRATTEGALALGYRVTLAQDGHSSFSKQARQLITEWNEKFTSQGIKVKPVREITWL